MTPNTRIYNKFKGYSMEDCDCRYCSYAAKGGKECTIPVCCCLAERVTAHQHKQIPEGKLNVRC